MGRGGGDGASPAALWAYDRYDLRDRFHRVFFNVDGTVGLFPTASYTSGFGFSAGARFIHTDLFGQGAGVSLEAGYGGERAITASAKGRSGRLLGRFELGVESSFSSARRSRFFGYGNGNLESPPDEPTAIDPRVDDTAVATRFRHEDIVAGLGTGAHITPTLKVELRGGFRHTSFRDDADPIDVNLVEVYDPAALTGFESGVDALIAETAITFKTLAPRYPHLSHAISSSGWWIGGFAGYQNGLGRDPSRFARYGADIQRHIDLYRGAARSCEVRISITRWWFAPASWPVRHRASWSRTPAVASSCSSWTAPASRR